MRDGDVKLRIITPGLIAKLIGANEIPQKEAYTKLGSLWGDRENCTQGKGRSQPAN